MLGLVRLWVGLATKLEKQLNAWFYNLGASVAKHPETYILCVLLVTAGCGTGLLQLRQVTDGGQVRKPKRDRIFSAGATSSRCGG